MAKRFKEEESDMPEPVQEELLIDPILGTPDRPEVIEQHRIMVEKAKQDQENNERS